MTDHPQSPSGDVARALPASGSDPLGDLADVIRGESSIGSPAKVEPAAAQHKAERTLAGRLHYFWSLTVAALLLLIFGTPVVPISWAFNRRHWVYPWALFGARNWLRLSGMEVVVHGRENLDPEKTYVLAANHRSYLDTALIFGHAGRRIGVLAKKELLKIPILGHGMGFVNIMAIDRTNRTRALETVRAATDRIRSGRTFGVFVEGRRAPRGELLPFKKGAFYMARDAGVDVVPVAIKNTDMLMGKGTGVSRPGRIEMVMLPPISTAGLTSDENISTLIAKVREAIKSELER